MTAPETNRRTQAGTAHLGLLTGRAEPDPSPEPWIGDAAGFSQEPDERARGPGICDQEPENPGQKQAQLQELFRTLLHERMTAKTRVHTADIK